MNNPFSYGEIVTGADFCDREAETEELLRDLKDGERIFLISPRRYGKSSLIANVKLKLEKEGIYVAYLDLFRLSSLKRLLEIYSKAITAATETRLAGIKRFAAEFLGKIRPKIIITPQGLPTIELGYEPMEKDLFSLLDEVYEIPQKIARKRKKRFAVIFDEFQEIETLEGEKVEKGMRAAFQQHKEVAYLFAGSKRHMMYNLVSNRNRAFYKMGRIFTLSKIPRDIFKKFIREKFKHSGFTLEEGVLDRVFDIAEEYPYNIQFICHRLWDLKLKEKKIKKGDVALAIESILSDQEMAYSALWETLAPNQQKLLSAIARFGGVGIQSGEFLKKAGLSTPSSAQSAKKSLLAKDIIDRENGNYFITDVFFGEWILRKILPYLT